MYIDEIPNNTKITIDFDSDNGHASIETKVKDNKGRAINKKNITTSISYKDHKIVNPNTFSGNVTVSCSPDNSNMAEIWKFVRIKYDRRVKEYIIETQANSTPVNRRKYYRVKMGTNAELRIEAINKIYTCSIHDLSLDGIAITMPSLSFSPVGRRFKLTFKDTKEYAAFTVNCTCVREATSSRNISLYGCRLNQTPPELMSYVRKKQREEMESKKKKK